MRDRHIFWDIAPLILLTVVAAVLIVILVQNERGWRVMEGIRKEQATLNSQNQKMLAALSDGVSVRGVNNESGTGTQGTRNPDGTAAEKRTQGMDHIPLSVKLPVLPKFTRGDENADDGDWLVETTSGEPNSLNPLRDNDASASSLFSLANDNLATRNFDDLAIWEPRLAHAWTSELVCYAFVKDGKAKELADEINKAWTDEQKTKLQIKKIAADSADVLRIDISDVNNDYRDLLQKDFGARLEMQWWFYVSYQGSEFMDGTPVTAPAMEARLIDGLKKGGFKGKLASGWPMEDKIILRVLGDEAARDQVEKILKDMAAAPENKARVIDEKSASGKREDKNFSYEMFEDYIAQEKPIFTFYLRKDVKWHDGQPFSGKDVLFSYNTMMNPKIECGHIRNYFNDCEKVELVENNPHIVRFTWIRPYFEAFTFSAGMDILPEHKFKFDDPKEFNEGPQNQTLNGNGAYKLERWERGSRFVFVRNEQYYGRKPHFKRLVIMVVKDPTAELQLLESGETDVYGLTPSQMEQREKNADFNARFNVKISISNVYRYIGWNARNPLFSDKRVRQALTMLIDRDRICKDIMRGYATPHHGTYHPDHPAFWKEIDARAWPYAPDRAMKQLADAGWKDTDGDGVIDKDGRPFKFTLVIRSNAPEHEAIANLVKSSLGKAGIVVNVSNLEWSVMLQQVERLKFDAVLLGWQLGLSGDPYQLWHSSQTGEKASNHCNFASKEADRIIESCRRELNDKKRYEKLRRFQEILLDEQPYTFLFVPKRLPAVEKRIENVSYKLIGSDRDRWWVPTAKQKHKD